MPFIELKNVSYIYPGTAGGAKALSGISMTVEKGVFIAVAGANGSGKSTLAKLLNRLLIPSEGQIIADSINSAEPKNIFEIRKRVGIVFQNPENQMVYDIIEDEVAFGPENLGLSAKEIRKRVDESLEAVGLKDFALSSVHELSGGQKQLLAIAGAIALKPGCLVLDEPVSMLDSECRALVFSAIRRLRKENNMAIILTSHSLSDIVDADMIYVLDKGRLALSGTPSAILSHAKECEKIGLEIPVVFKLSALFERKGISFEGKVLTEDMLVSELVKLKDKEKLK